MVRTKSTPVRIAEMVYVYWDIEGFTNEDRNTAIAVARKSEYGIVSIIPATKTHDDKLAAIIRISSTTDFKELLRGVEFYSLLPDPDVEAHIDYFYTNFVIEEHGFPYIRKW